ncbi:MAG: hypothetical protein H0Z33_13655 [Bacillaceae bacterium]|nr:hypothetical protein [Bacillaceae bacterium]
MSRGCQSRCKSAGSIKCYCKGKEVIQKGIEKGKQGVKKASQAVKNKFKQWVGKSNVKPSNVSGSGDHLRRTFNVNRTKIQINSGHGYNRPHKTESVEGIGSMDEIESVIIKDVFNARKAGLSIPNRPPAIPREVTVNVKKIGYDIFQTSDGTIRISTYYPK